MCLPQPSAQRKNCQSPHLIVDNSLFLAIDGELRELNAFPEGINGHQLLQRDGEGHGAREEDALASSAC